MLGAASRGAPRRVSGQDKSSSLFESDEAGAEHAVLYPITHDDTTEDTRSSTRSSLSTVHAAIYASAPIWLRGRDESETDLCN